jgi:hypothetical protein
MRFCASGGNDTNDGASYRIGDNEHPAVYHADGVEAQLIFNVAVLNLDHMRVEKDLGGRIEDLHGVGLGLIVALK